MITLNIVAGPHCSLKTAWSNRAFHNVRVISAEQLFDRFSDDPDLLFDDYLIKNFENIWIDNVVNAINIARDDSSIVLDGVTLDDQRLAYNFSYAENVQRFIDIIRDAAAKGFIHKQFQFVIHWLALPLPLRQIFNHRTPRPYTTDQLKHNGYWAAKMSAPDVKIIIHNTDDVFSAFYIE